MKSVRAEADRIIRAHPRRETSPYKICSVALSGKAELIDELLRRRAEAIVRRERAFSLAEITTSLRTEFDIKIGESTLLRHARELCQCRRT